MVLDQGREGACTGFGPGAMINYLFWRRELSRSMEQAVFSPPADD